MDQAAAQQLYGTIITSVTALIVAFTAALLKQIKAQTQQHAVSLDKLHGKVDALTADDDHPTPYPTPSGKGDYGSTAPTASSPVAKASK